jgi:hypothetical protein
MDLLLEIQIGVNKRNIELSSDPEDNSVFSKVGQRLFRRPYCKKPILLCHMQQILIVIQQFNEMVTKRC